jgi:hypothetical protein
MPFSTSNSTSELKSVLFRVDKDFARALSLSFLVDPLTVVCKVGGFAIIVYFLCWVLVSKLNQLMLNKKLVESLYQFNPAV